jgi:ABC-type transport system involved in multi-copper enzyme maturation permease subunit
MLNVLWLLGPVFAKEMVEIARRKRYYVNRVIYGLALLFTMFMLWQEYGYRIERYTGGEQVRRMAEFANAIFVAVSLVQYISVYLFVPLYICGTVASEREEKTLDLLFTTHLTNRQIILGKLGSRLAALLVIIFGGLPVLSLISLFGGVDPVSLFRVFALTLLAAFWAGAHAIYFSTITKSPIGALIRTYWWMAVWLGGVVLLVMIPVIAMKVGPPHPWAMFFLSILLFLEPYFPLIPLFILDAERDYTTYLGGSWYFYAAFVIPALWSLLLVVLAIWRLKWEPVPFGYHLARLPGIREAVRSYRGWTAARAERKRFSPQRTWYYLNVRNPLWHRARIVRVYDREGYIGRIQWLCWIVAIFFVLLVGALSARELKDEAATMTFGALGWLAVAALTAVFAGSSIVGDRRRGFFDQVLVTPLSSREIIDGTLLAVWQHVRRLYWLPVVFVLCLSAIGDSTMLGALFSIATITLNLMVLAIYGVGCSLAARTFASALVATFIMPLVVNVGIVFLIPLFREAAGPVLWIMTMLFFAGSLALVQARKNVATVSLFLIMLHLAILELATFWTWTGGMRFLPYPIIAMNAGYLSMTVLDHRDPSRWLEGGVSTLLLFPCYWLALLTTFLVMRWWLIANFETLVDRAQRRERLRWRIPRWVRRRAASPPTMGATGEQNPVLH